MSNIIEFSPPDRSIAAAEAEVHHQSHDDDSIHAEAFRDLEGRLSDCMTMASIAVQMVEPAIAGRDAKHEKAMFAVFHVAVMLKRLHADYQTAYHGHGRIDP